MNYELSKLFIDNCPIFTFDKKETYMPIDFKNMLEIANINLNNLNKVNIINIDEDEKKYNNIGRQILCKTNKTIIDLYYLFQKKIIMFIIKNHYIYLI